MDWWGGLWGSVWGGSLSAQAAGSALSVMGALPVHDGTAHLSAPEALVPWRPDWARMRVEDPLFCLAVARQLAQSAAAAGMLSAGYIEVSAQSQAFIGS
jgi:hypothetical protein